MAQARKSLQALHRLSDLSPPAESASDDYSNVVDEQLVDCFLVFNRNSSGKISAYELAYVMTNLGDCLTEEEVEEMILEADVDNDGMINYAEFCRMMVAERGVLNPDDTQQAKL